MEQHQFRVLQSIASLVNSKEDEDFAREIILRALNNRHVFNGFEPILNALVRQVGLFPYADAAHLSERDLIAYEAHRPGAVSEDIVFHTLQADVYNRLVNGDNVILSAPTSFGKSKIIDAIVENDAHNNIAVVVPTIALIDETRRRISGLSHNYKVVTQIGQNASERNVFVFTAERLLAYDGLPKINFFVIDEFYKLGDLESGALRAVALNQAFYKLYKQGGQCYLLGPSIRQINVIILDSSISMHPYNFFTFNNIKGRSGRMFHHFIGRVYLFNPPPPPELPFVDFPIFTQDEEVPESLLVQIEENDLSPRSLERLTPFVEQGILPMNGTALSPFAVLP